MIANVSATSGRPSTGGFPPGGTHERRRPRRANVRVVDDGVEVVDDERPVQAVRVGERAEQHECAGAQPDDRRPAARGRARRRRDATLRRCRVGRPTAHGATHDSPDATFVYYASAMHERSLRALITAEEMRAFSRPAGWRMARDLTAIWVQIVAAGALYVLHPAWWTYAGAFVLIAGGQHGLAMATHEFAHYSVWPAKRRLNDVLGGWLFGAPVGIPLAIFRHRHFEHHRTFSTHEDPKTVYRHSVRGVRLLREIVRGLVGWEFIGHARIARARHARDAAAGTPARRWPARCRRCSPRRAPWPWCSRSSRVHGST